MDRMFENNEMQSHYEKSRPQEKQQHSEPEEEGPSIEDHVSEHGPADHVEIHSYHGGKVHKSKHHDAKSAHDHIDKAFDEEHESKESPEFEAGEQEGMHEQTASIPGLK